MQQQRLFETDDKEKQARSLPALLKGMGDMRRRILNLELALRSLERAIIDERATLRPRRRHSMDAEGLAFLQEKFLSDPTIKSHQLIKLFRAEAAKRGWRSGSDKTLYRVIRDLRQGIQIADNTERG